MFRVFEGERRPLARLRPARARASTGCAASTPPRADLGGVHVALLVFSAVRPARHLRDPPACRTSCRSTRSASPRCRRISPSTPPPASPPTPTGRRTRGESTMSYLTQMAGLAWHNFISAAAGIGVALALGARPHAPAGARRRRRRSATSGSTSSARIVYVLLPLSIVVGAGPGLAGRDPEPRRRTSRSTTLEGAKQMLAWGRSPRRRRSRSSAPTAAASSTPTAPTRSRTRRRSPTSSRCC